MRHLVTVLAAVSLLFINATSPAIVQSPDATDDSGTGSDPTLAPARPPALSIVVTSTADSGPGSLRQALESSPPHDTITFDPDVFPPDTPARIVVESGLPHLHQGNVTIDDSDSWLVLDGSEVSRAGPSG